MFRYSLSAIALVALVAACGDKTFAPGTAGDAPPPPVATTAEGEAVGEETNLADDLLDKLTDEGKSIIMISSEMEEVLRLSDRIAVMCNGRITGYLSNEEATQEKIMELATQFQTKQASEA